MARIFKISGYLVSNTDITADGQKAWLEKELSYKEMWQQLHVEQSEDFNFNGENRPNCDLALLERHFKPKIKPSKCNRPLPKAGDRYRHFKTGKIATVIGISQHTETLEETVVYECEGRIWNRPLDMFMSEVDREKYPSAKQKYRLEKIEDGKREIEYTRSNGETVIVRCGGVLYRLIRFTNWLKEKVDRLDSEEH